jgi:hypothetical protein
LSPDSGFRGLLREASSQVREERAYQKIIKSGDRDRAPEAAFNLGKVLEGRRLNKRARAAYQAAIDSGHPELAPAAANNLGKLLYGEGDMPGARAARRPRRQVRSRAGADRACVSCPGDFMPLPAVPVTLTAAEREALEERARGARAGWRTRNTWPARQVLRGRGRKTEGWRSPVRSYCAWH